METKIQMHKTETSPAIAVALLEDEKNSKRPIIFGHGAACIIRAMPISDSGACRSLIPFHADR